MGLLKLFVTASMPVLNVLIVTGVGSFLATDYSGILGEDARKRLNNVVFFVFNPALVWTNLSRTITWESMVSLWFMPINVLLTFILGSILGWILIQITKAPSHLRGLILGCCSAGNLGNLPLIIIPSICKEKGSPFGVPDVCHTYGLAYTSLSMALGAIFIWSYVYNMIRLSSTTIENEALAHEHNPAKELPEEREKLIEGNCRDETTSTGCCSVSVHFADDLAPTVSNEFSTKTKVFGARARFGSRVRADDVSASVLFEVPISVIVGRFFSTLSEVIDFRKLFAPSTIAVILGFIVGVIPQIRKAMIGESAPLRVIEESAALLGDGAIPSLTLIMGGNLMKGLRGSGIKFSLIAGITVVRYIILPLLGIVVVKGAVLIGLVHADPLYQFVLLLQFALPPAMNIGTMTQLFGAGQNECSVIFLWTYALASLALTFWSTLFMWLVS